MDTVELQSLSLEIEELRNDLIKSVLADPCSFDREKTVTLCNQLADKIETCRKKTRTE